MTSKTSNQKHGQGQGAGQQKKRPRGDRQLCGAYNYRGCTESGNKCSFAHKYSIWAGTLYYSTLGPSEQASKGLIVNSWFPAEFKDLRLRNVNSLTENKQLELIRLPLLSPSTTAPHGDSKRRKKATQAMQGGINKELEVKLVDMENAASTTDDSATDDAAAATAAAPSPSSDAMAGAGSGLAFIKYSTCRREKAVAAARA